MMSTDDELITVREAARLCRRTAETIRRWIWAEKLPARKLGNQLFVNRADLDRMEVSGKRLSTREFQALMKDLARLRERIRDRLGHDLDVVELLEESRASHP